MAENPSRDQLRSDFGLGGKLTDRQEARLLNHDGTFNVRRNEYSRIHPYNAYHTVLELPLSKLFVLIACCYAAANLLFAIFYYLCGPGAIAGEAATPFGRFEDCAFFSVQTFATIGYGRLVPATGAANALVALEALIGVLSFAVLSGVLFARFTRPTAKIRFSDNALIAPYRGGWALMFRLVNLRNHDLTDVTARVSFSRWTTRDGTRRRAFDSLPLERDSIIFMPLHWVIVHPIDDASPFRGLTPEGLVGCEPEIYCLVSGDDETFAQRVHAKTSYTTEDLVWGAKFTDMYLDTAKFVAIDIKRLDGFEKVAGPTAL